MRLAENSVLRVILPVTQVDMTPCVLLQNDVLSFGDG
jgi:hypothetical protein